MNTPFQNVNDSDPLDPGAPMPTISDAAIARRDAHLHALRERVQVSGRARARRRHLVRGAAVMAFVAIAVGVPAVGSWMTSPAPTQAIEVAAPAPVATGGSAAEGVHTPLATGNRAGVRRLSTDGSGILRGALGAETSAGMVRPLRVERALVRRVDDRAFVAQASAGGRDVGIVRVGDEVRVIAAAPADSPGG